MWPSKWYSSIVFIFWSWSVAAQQETTIPMLSFTPQSGYADVTRLSNFRTSVAFPILGGLHQSFLNSGFTFNELVTSDNIVDPNRVIPGLNKMNFLTTNGSLEWFNVRIRKDDKQWQVSLREVYSLRVNYPQTLAQLVWYGNGYFAGQTADLSGFRIQQNLYRELAIGYTKKINDRWTIGFKPKLLFGITNVTTRHSTNTLYTESNGLELTGTADIDIYTSGLIDEQGDIAVEAKTFLGLKNLGWGLDAGTRYKVSDKVTLAANAVNLGMIRWKNQITRYDVNGEYSYTGLVLRDSADLANADWQNVLDTLESIFKPDISRSAYTSYLSPQIYLTGEYVYSQKLTFFASYISDIYYRYRPMFSVGGVVQLGQLFQATVNYTYMTENAFNLGGGFAFNAGPVQLYISCDHLPAAFDPYNQKYFNVRGGINFVFGKVDSGTVPLTEEK